MDGVEVTWAVVADFANADAANKLNLIGVFRDLNPASFPFECSFYFVAYLEASPIEVGSVKTLRVAMNDQDAKSVLFSQELQFPVPSPPAIGSGQSIGIQLIVPMPGLVFKSAGDFQINVLINGETRKTLPVRVTQRAPVQ